MQHEALSKLYEMEEEIIATEDDHLINDWRRLQSSDHFYYMCTRLLDEGKEDYFGAYESPYEAFMGFMNVIKDIQLRLGEYQSDSNQMRTATQIIPQIQALVAN